MAGKPDERRSVATNRRARHEYLILDELECGIALVGTEVKSLRAGHCNLSQAYARIHRDELWLIGCSIPEYAHGNINNHVPDRDRKLLAKRREIAKWTKAVREKGVTIVPLEVFWSGSLVKVKIALARGKKLYDKRATDKARTDKRDMDRAMSRRR